MRIQHSEFGRMIAAAACAAALLCAPSGQKASAADEDVYEIAREAYVYAYPMVVMEITRQCEAR